MTPPSFPRLRDAIIADDCATAAALLDSDADLRTALDEPMFVWGQPPVTAARSIEMATLLLEAGASATHVGAWWAGGFGLGTEIDTDVAQLLIERGATASPHAAAALGLVDRLEHLLRDDPSCVDAKGIDACTPLHFAGDVSTADVLLEHGARIDARDEDHDSTPAHWLIGRRPEVARHLLERGATADLFLAAALGDGDLAHRLVDEDPRCLTHFIGRDPPGIGKQGTPCPGGTILQWTLAFNSFAHQIAVGHGHDALFETLYARSDSVTQLLVACLLGRRDLVEGIVGEHPDIVRTLPAVHHELPALYCWETNANIDAVRLMLDIGFPVDTAERRHGYTPLHNAAWGGYADLVDLLIERGHPVDGRDPEHQGTPLDWALHCCLHDGRHPEGAYEHVIAALIDAGCPWDPGIHPTGHAGIDRVLARTG